ncbi:MAG: AAA family ATPase [Bacillaceae bacterium]
MIYKQQNDIIEAILTNIDRVIIGKRSITELSLVTLLAEGHMLLEDVPGVGKTMMVKALAASINANFKRIQFTPDLLPSDVTGTNIFDPRYQEFVFHPGPIMGNIILADEINRTSPKTQSALLEGLEEGSVTIDGVTRKLEKPFFVMATQNPIEYEGTYPLPEAQLDRFLLKVKIGYPTLQEEIEILSRAQFRHPIEDIAPVATLEDIRDLQEKVKQVLVGGEVKRYIVQLIHQTRRHQHVELGVSPRGSLALMKAGQAYACIHDRDYVIPDDIRYLAPFVLGHRIILKPEVRYSGVTQESFIQDIIANVPIPFQRIVKK